VSDVFVGLQDGVATQSAGSDTISSSRTTATSSPATGAPAACAAGLAWSLENQGGRHISENIHACITANGKWDLTTLIHDQLMSICCALDAYIVLRCVYML
jgi:hypothetical protein